MLKSIKLLHRLIFSLIFILVISVPVLAVTAESDDNITVKTGDTAKGPRFYAGSSVKIDGTVDGTVFSAAREITINGTINGDLFTAAQEITINGKVMGNLYAAGQDVKIAGQVSGDVFGAGQKIDVTKDALLQRDALLAGAKIVHNGQIQRQLLGYGENISVSGLVGSDASMEVEKLEIRDGTMIKGNLTYRSPNKASISNTAKVNGPIDWQKTEPRVHKEKPRFADNFISLILGLLGALLIWFLIHLWRPAFWSSTATIIREQPLKTLGVGALVLILTPILVILLMITVIGIPLGVIVGLAYGVGIYLAKIIVAVFIGFQLSQKFHWPQLHRGVWLVLLGLAILALLTRIPFIGFLVTLLVVFAGLGSILLTYAKPAPKEEPPQPA
ncbi:MAG: hypothetical protein JG781_2036 [Peptococcaceae bacterium]|jgi:cytoskeletal protein CcmA (bactofilin family)|nr:hypothetical protein [Peptococcaceae bacterium]